MGSLVRRVGEGALFVPVVCALSLGFLPLRGEDISEGSAPGSGTSGQQTSARGALPLELWAGQQPDQSWSEASAFCRSLGDEWRLPAVEEVSDLVDRVDERPYERYQNLPGLWTCNAGTSARYAWFLDVRDNRARLYTKSGRFRTLCVRGGEADCPARDLLDYFCIRPTLFNGPGSLAGVEFRRITDTGESEMLGRSTEQGICFDRSLLADTLYFIGCLDRRCVALPREELGLEHDERILFPGCHKCVRVIHD